MSALLTKKSTSRRVIKRCKRPLKDNVKAIQGGLCAVHADGFYGPVLAASGLIVVGVFTETVDNTGGADGAKSAEVDFFRERHVFLCANDGTNPCTVADRERECYAVDDQTVSTLGTSRSIAGRVFDVVSGEGVWVEVGAGMVEVAV